MAEADLDTGLKTLRQTLQEMKALLAWQKLKYDEVRRKPVSVIRLNDTTYADLTDRYSFFLSIAMQMHHILDSGNIKITRAKQNRIKSELVTMEYQVHYLGSGIRFY